MIMICKPLLRYHSVESWNSKKQMMLYNYFFLRINIIGFLTSPDTSVTVFFPSSDFHVWVQIKKNRKNPSKRFVLT